MIGTLTPMKTARSTSNMSVPLPPACTGASSAAPRRLTRGSTPSSPRSTPLSSRALPGPPTPRCELASPASSASGSATGPTPRASLSSRQWFPPPTQHKPMCWLSITSHRPTSGASAPSHPIPALPGSSERFVTASSALPTGRFWRHSLTPGSTNPSFRQVGRPRAPITTHALRPTTPAHGPGPTSSCPPEASPR